MGRRCRRPLQQRLDGVDDRLESAKVVLHLLDFESRSSAAYAIALVRNAVATIGYALETFHRRMSCPLLKFGGGHSVDQAAA